MEKRARRKYSPEFKREAVQLANNPGQSVAGVARDLGIKENLLRRWKHELEQHGQLAFGGQGVARDEELMRLRRELAQVKKERDFLRSAAVYFAKDGK
jgi:transposase